MQNGISLKQLWCRDLYIFIYISVFSQHKSRLTDPPAVSFCLLREISNLINYYYSRRESRGERNNRDFCFDVNLFKGLIFTWTWIREICTRKKALFLLLFTFRMYDVLVFRGGFEILMAATCKGIVCRLILVASLSLYGCFWH